jgi:hypothetical protein
MAKFQETAARWFWLIFGDVRSAIIGAIAAAIGAYCGAVYAQSQETKSFSAVLSDTGVGYPALLFSEASREDKELRIDFSPKELNRVAVCEYFADKKETLRAIMDQYLQKNSSCFIPVWRDKKILEIRPNLFSGQLAETTNKSGVKQFWCKCTPQQISSSQ